MRLAAAPHLLLREREPGGAIVLTGHGIGRVEISPQGDVHPVIGVADHRDVRIDTVHAVTAKMLGHRGERHQRSLRFQRPTGLERDIPDYKALFENARQANPVVAALRKDAEAARTALQAERARSRPTLNAEIEAADYERNLQARSSFRAGLSLRIPLYQGGEVDAAVMRAASEQAAREAQLRKAEYDLQKTVLDAVQGLETLKVKRQAAKQRVAFRDLYLDRARAIYDMEVQISLGDAMTRLTEAQWLATKADFEFALAWARIEALTGKLIDTSVQETKP